MVGSLRYEIERTLGEGGTAETFIAREPGRQEPVVLKLFRSRDRSEAVIARFMRQLESCRRVDHPRLVKHLDAGLSAGKPYLAMEWLEGEDLAAHVRRTGPIAPADLVRLIVPICELLEQLGASGIYYPELRASDLFLQGGLPRYEPKLLDAGRAWLGDCGVFRPPECESGESGGLRAEVFALGVLMYEALEGRPPFVDDEGDPWARGMDSLSSFRGPSVALMGIVERCLSQDPRNRFAGPAELARSIASGWSPAAAVSTGVKAVEDSEAGEPKAEREQVGELLGSYRLEKLLGEGSMGRVFLARHTLLGRTAAIKVMRPEYAHAPQFVERFFQEAKAVNQINHEHIVEVLDFAEDKTEHGRRVYCVMEMLEGQSLTELLEREAISIQRTLDIARQICVGLDAAHRLGVVHRDIKPDNIFITDRQGVPDYVKIVDFGVAKVISPTSNPSPGRTLEGTIVGTPSYMAPEQAAGFAADPRSDIYSVGAVIYQMLAGRVPFEAATFGQLMAKVIAQPAPPLGTLTPSGERISPELAALVMSSLEKDPRRRPESMTLLGQALAAIERAGAAPRRKFHWKSIALKATPALLAVVSVAAFLRLPEHGPAVPPAPRAELRPIAPPRTMARTPSSAPETQSVNVRIASNPPGARVIRADSGAELGFTPLYRPFSPTERDVVLRLELPGHRPIEQTIQPAERPSVEVKMSRLKLSAKKRSAFKGSREKIGKDGLINPFAE